MVQSSHVSTPSSIHLTSLAQQVMGMF
jgi:hypothetical protein